MAGKADMGNSIVDRTAGFTATKFSGDAAYASLNAAVATGAEAERGGWVADG
jgi:hypothetical protein